MCRAFQVSSEEVPWEFTVPLQDVYMYVHTLEVPCRSIVPRRWIASKEKHFNYLIMKITMAINLSRLTHYTLHCTMWHLAVAHQLHFDGSNRGPRALQNAKKFWTTIQPKRKALSGTIQHTIQVSIAEVPCECTVPLQDVCMYVYIRSSMPKHSSSTMGHM